MFRNCWLTALCSVLLPAPAAFAQEDLGPETVVRRVQQSAEAEILQHSAPVPSYSGSSEIRYPQPTMAQPVWSYQYQYAAPTVIYVYSYPSGFGCPCMGAGFPSAAGMVPGGWVMGGGGIHYRYPYYSYRRPWYSPGPAVRNYTIP